jgi:hypothetical protein
MLRPLKSNFFSSHEHTLSKYNTFPNEEMLLSLSSASRLGQDT